MSGKFDEIARIIGSQIPRRQALRLIGSAIVGGGSLFVMGCPPAPVTVCCQLPGSCFDTANDQKRRDSCVQDWGGRIVPGTRCNGSVCGNQQACNCPPGQVCIGTTTSTGTSATTSIGTGAATRECCPRARACNSNTICCPAGQMCCDGVTCKERCNSSPMRPFLSI
jgi:hypothetical protein